MTTALLSATPALEFRSGWKIAWPLNATAIGGNDDSVPGHTASGNSCLVSSAPSGIGSALVASPSTPGNRYPLRRNVRRTGRLGRQLGALEPRPERRERACGAGARRLRRYHDPHIVVPTVRELVVVSNDDDDAHRDGGDDRGELGDEKHLRKQAFDSAHLPREQHATCQRLRVPQTESAHELREVESRRSGIDDQPRGSSCLRERAPRVRELARHAIAACPGQR